MNQGLNVDKISTPTTLQQRGTEQKGTTSASENAEPAASPGKEASGAGQPAPSTQVELSVADIRLRSDTTIAELPQAQQSARDVAAAFADNALASVKAHAGLTQARVEALLAAPPPSDTFSI